MHTQEEQVPTHRAEIGDEPEALLASWRRRLHVDHRPAGRLAWAAAMAIFGLALVLRLWGLGGIGELIFDETYYVKDGYALTQEGVEMDWPEEPDAAFEAGDVDTYLEGDPAYVVHPPLGKWLIGAGMMLLGADSPWGWRISTALAGSLAVLMVTLIGRRLFRSTAVGLLAGLLMAVDGMAIVHARTSLLDNFVMVFALAAFGALLIDRDRFRARLAMTMARIQTSAEAEPPLGVPGGLRPWRLLAGVLLGMACSVKWSGLWFVAVFGIMTVLWDWWARRTVARRRWFLSGLLRDAIPAFFATVGTALVVYVASWSGWFASAIGYHRQVAAEQGVATGTPIVDALHSLWIYHRQAYEFHVGLDSEHPYEASPLGWLIMLRPTNFYYRSYDYGEQGCEVARCAAQILNVGNPLIWWLGALAVVVTLVLAVWFRDGRAWAALSGIAAGYLPWLMYLDRTIFTFYAIAFTPWVMLCLAYVLGLVLGGEDADRERRLAGGLFVGSLMVLIVLVSAFFWPLWTGQVIDAEQWHYRIWLPSWS
ncbi:dolichyl-phosphate-mannose--protein mannosyltransferase [Brachybacterium sp. J153]|uniref:dolichyl-phosphate-mannose--protein mannosyltransferase n=1 Tax=Brachybacterium sp. J153 TaxID=3116488 RepID=UPI002E76CF33|nr:phospholipid carrier-dependent glycosyltransferase [Brachybacterium sp. J153]MEE1619072.1 phospholipid carrier-dependent glycosyltransferase [Brachybacterium sp. J153]